jgi:hypothetical protein
MQHGAATLSKNFRRQGIRSKFNGKPNPLHPHDRRSTDTLAAGEYAALDVDDPYGQRGDKITVLRQLRCDPLARLHSHRQIDDAQFYAGRAYQRDWEVAEQGARAIDPTKEAVDGGRLPEILPDRQIEARNRLIQVRGVLGRRLSGIVDAVLIEGSTIEKISHSPAETWLKYYGRLFRHGLDELAVEYHFADKKSVAGPANQ